MNHLLRHTAAIVLAIASLPLATAADAPAAGQPQIIVLKLDDIIAPGMPRWQRVTEFLEREGIGASYGIMGYSLEQDKPDYFKEACGKVGHDKECLALQGHPNSWMTPAGTSSSRSSPSCSPRAAGS